MIKEIIQVLDAASSGIPIAIRHGLAEMVEKDKQLVPAIHTGNGQFVFPWSDVQGSWSYWRLLKKPQYEPADIFQACAAVRAVYELRWVGFIGREGPCSDLPPMLESALNSMRGAKRSTVQATGAAMVLFPRSSISTDQQEIRRAEFAGAVVPTEKQLFAIDITVEVKAPESCMESCADPVTVTVGDFCDIVQSNTWENIEECLTDSQRTAAEAELAPPIPIVSEFGPFMVGAGIGNDEQALIQPDGDVQWFPNDNGSMVWPRAESSYWKLRTNFTPVNWDIGADIIPVTPLIICGNVLTGADPTRFPHQHLQREEPVTVVFHSNGDAYKTGHVGQATNSNLGVSYIRINLVGVRIEDNLGNLVAIVEDGDTYTLP